MSTVENKQAPEEVKVNAYAFLVAVLAALTWGASFISRSVWSSAIASESTLTSLGITALEAGGIATAFYVGYVASNFFSGIIIDNFGTKVSLAITALGTGAATLLIAFCNGYWAIFALRVLAGIFAGPLFSCIVKCNYAYFPDRLRAVMTGFLGSGSSIGTAIASIWFTPMVAEKGYKVAFTWAGIVTFAIGVIVFFLVKDIGVMKPLKKMDVLSEEEKKNATASAIKVFMQKDFLIGSLTHFCCMCATTGMQTWMLSYLINNKGMEPATAGLVFGSSQLIGLISGTLAGIVSDALKTRKWLMTVSALGTAALILLFLKVDSVAGLTAIFIIIKLFQSFVGTSSNTMQSERAKGPYSGLVMGWYNAICQLGSVVMPTVLGAVLAKTGDYGQVVIWIAGTYICIMVLGLLVKDTYRKKA